MLKKYVLFFLLLLPFALLAQTGDLLIQSGTELQLRGEVKLVLHNINLHNQGAIAADSSELLFTGANTTSITSGGSALHDLQIAKSNDQHLQLKDDLNIYGTLQFTGMENLLEIDSSHLILATTAAISGADRNNFVLTDSTGWVLKKDLTNFTFPVGPNSNSYHPLSVEQTGTIDHLSLRCLPAAYTEGDSGAPFNEGVVATAWDLRENTPGGSVLNLTAQWEKTIELVGFTRDDCGLARYAGNGQWDLSPDDLAAASGPNPFTQSIAQVEPGIFIVSGDTLMNKVLLDLQVFLQGPYNGSSMNDQIRNAGNLPGTSPYGTGKFVDVGRGGGEMATANAFDANGDDSVVDWVFVWLKDANDPSITLQTRAALLQKDGDIVDLDGVSGLWMPGDSGSYHIGVGHRNHLSIRTANALALTESSPLAYDFSRGAGQAYGSSPMAEQGGVYLLWGGNTNENTNIRATGPPFINDYVTILSLLGSANNVLFNQYTSEDVNMDGTVRLTGPPTINDYAKLLNILSSPTNIIYEQF